MVEQISLSNGSMNLLDTDLLLHHALRVIVLNCRFLSILDRKFLTATERPCPVF